MFHLPETAVLCASTAMAAPASTQGIDFKMVVVVIALIALLALVLIAIATIVLVAIRMNHRRRSERDQEIPSVERITPDPWELAGKRLKPDAPPTPRKF